MSAATTVLFITRKYPPAIGGMEQLSYQLITGVGERSPTQIVSWGGSQKWVPLFMMYACGRALSIVLTKRVDVLHFSDLVLAPLAVLLRRLTGKPVAINAHGLDIQYPNRLYQAVVPVCARRLDAIICNSQNTRRECLARGLGAERTVVITPGVSNGSLLCQLSPEEGAAWRRRLGLGPDQPHILLTVGRLVPRKGVCFFVNEVAPALLRRRRDWAYIVIGEGAERRNIEEAIRVQGLERYVRLLGQVDAAALQTAYAAADLFIMPNVAIPGDSEGFGLVSLEARAAGLPVAAARLEGIIDSFSSVDDGDLVSSGDASGFVEVIDRRLEHELTGAERQQRREATLARYGWSAIIQRYLDLFEALRAGRAVGDL